MKQKYVFIQLYMSVNNFTRATLNQPAKTRPPTLCRIRKTLTCKTCLFFLFFLQLNFNFFRHFVHLHLNHISYPVLLTLFAVAAILNASPSSLETRDLLCARVFSRAAAILKSEKTLGTRLEMCRHLGFQLRDFGLNQPSTRCWNR